MLASSGVTTSAVLKFMNTFFEVFVLDFSRIVLMTAIAGIGSEGTNMANLTFNRLTMILVGDREGMVL